MQHSCREQLENIVVQLVVPYPPIPWHNAYISIGHHRTFQIHRSTLWLLATAVAAVRI